MVGYNSLIERVDVIAMGSRSYQQIMTFGDWSWPDKQTYVFTSKPMKSKFAYVEFVDDTPAIFKDKICNGQLNGDIWLLGGHSLRIVLQELI